MNRVGKTKEIKFGYVSKPQVKKRFRDRNILGYYNTLYLGAEETVVWVRCLPCMQPAQDLPSTHWLPLPLQE